MDIMSHKNRGLKFLQGLGYGVLSFTSGVATAFFATATVVLAASIVGIPLAILTAVTAVTCATGVVYFAYKAGDKFACAFTDEHHDHKHGHHIKIYPVAAHFEKNQTAENNASLHNEADLKGSSKPLFIRTSDKHARTAINSEEFAAKANM